MRKLEDVVMSFIRFCGRIRGRQDAWLREQQVAAKKHLDGLPPEERLRVLTEVPEDSCLHPRNLPYDRAKPGRFD